MATDPVIPSQDDDSPAQDAEDPLSFGGPFTAMTGLLIALISVSVPLIAVITDRTAGPNSFMPTALESHGSEPPASLSSTGAGQSSRRDPSW